MTVQDLKDIKRRRDKITRLAESIERLRSVMESTTQMLSFVAVMVGSQDKLAAQVSELMELLGERAGQVIALEHHLDMVERWLNTLPEQQAKVMRLRYVDGLAWRQVAKRAGYTSEHCRKINCAAIRKLDTQ